MATKDDGGPERVVLRAVLYLVMLSSALGGLGLVGRKDETGLAMATGLICAVVALAGLAASVRD